MNAAVGMPCPVCKVALVMSDRQGVEIDYCPQCRGVWLDRGELDKILERSATEVPPGSVKLRLHRNICRPISAAILKAMRTGNLTKSARNHFLRNYSTSVGCYFACTAAARWLRDLGVNIGGKNGVTTVTLEFPFRRKY